ncbi:hypothetical protein KGM_204741 [Danaus plexippus plexippus]|uniref:Uncharacterized protein n=1 Tax=Danaus plexippus plexippus TaxID=278856 RepID=A0A212EX28_DANPL|nr:hypothetical protein KGM_204741 [Danaus plexippus plexippus]
MKSSAVGRAMRHFYKTTTLHGFKYLCSKYYCDRVGWLLCCVASACCAGVLCAVLWARFLQVPAVLTLHDMRGATMQMKLPTVAVCPPPQSVARLFEQKFEEVTERKSNSAAGRPYFKRASLDNVKKMFFTGYKGEEWVEPKSLTPGFNYLAQMSFTSVIDKDSDKLVDGTCMTTEGYTKRECLVRRRL